MIALLSLLGVAGKTFTANNIEVEFSTNIMCYGFSLGTIDDPNNIAVTVIFKKPVLETIPPFDVKFSFKKNFKAVATGDWVLIKNLYDGITNAPISSNIKGIDAPHDINLLLFREIDPGYMVLTLNINKKCMDNNSINNNNKPYPLAYKKRKVQDNHNNNNTKTNTRAKTKSSGN